MQSILFKILGLLLKQSIRSFQNAQLPKEVKVLYAKDGDSLVCSDEKGEVHEIRIHGIDAPEMTQVFGKQAQAYLQKKTKGKTLRLLKRHKDHYERIATKAMLKTPEGEICLGLDLIEKGFAWACPRRSNSKMRKAQKRAAKEIQGIWENPNPITPWKFRKRQTLEATRI